MPQYDKKKEQNCILFYCLLLLAVAVNSVVTAENNEVGFVLFDRVLDELKHFSVSRIFILAVCKVENCELTVLVKAKNGKIGVCCKCHNTACEKHSNCKNN